jgi:ketosteroid isomerase-like protein
MVERRTFLFVAVLWLGGCRGPQKETSVGNTFEQTQAIAALREAYAAFNRGDIDAAVKSLDEQIEWSEPVEFPGGGTYHGRERAKRYLAQSYAAWAEVASEPEQFILHGDQVVVFVHARVRAKGSNDWQDVRLADVYTFRDGKAVRMHAFADRQQALRSVGIEAPAG